MGDGRLERVGQRADDLDRAVEFYTTVLGGELMARFEPPGLAFVRMGEVRLLLEKAAPAVATQAVRDSLRRRVRRFALPRAPARPARAGRRGHGPALWPVRG